MELNYIMDDMIITGDDESAIAQLKRKLGKELKVKDSGQLRYFLGNKEIGRAHV